MLTSKSDVVASGNQPWLIARRGGPLNVTMGSPMSAKSKKCALSAKSKIHPNLKAK
jgi:hypothetical protein